MATGKFIAYLRLSTERQGKSGRGLEARRNAVTDYLNGGKWTLLGEFVEVESGKNADRPKLAAAMAECRLTGATLVIAKLDRLSRDASFLIGLDKAGLDFVAADMPNANRLTVGIMALVAQQEREAISARTKAALAAAKARGTVLGGFKGVKVNPAAGRAAIATKTEAFRASVRPIAQAMRNEGMSLRQIAAALEARNIRTPRGAAWSAATVLAVLK